MNEWLSGMNEWMNDSVEWLTDWLTDWMNERMNEWLSGMTEWMNEWVEWTNKVNKGRSRMNERTSETVEWMNDGWRFEIMYLVREWVEQMSVINKMNEWTKGMQNTCNFHRYYVNVTIYVKY